MLLKRSTRTIAQKSFRILLWVAGLVLLFSLYTLGISQNPQGFYLDESATAYNAYLVSRTGAGEFGPPFPLLFQQYAYGNPTYMNPLAIYLLAVVFRFLPPTIPVARTFAAFWMFTACLLLGVLAKRISGERKIGVIVAATALLTPWFFEAGRLVFDAHLPAFTIALFLLATYRIHSKEIWTWPDFIMVGGSLGLVTYGYFSGRALAPLYALGLLLLATTRRRLMGVLQVWFVYILTVIPLILFNRSHPGMLTKRLYEVSYIQQSAPWKQWREIVPELVRRFLEDQSLTPLLITGDYHPRHHVQGSGGPILFATFILAVIGLIVIVLRRWREPWWRFVLYGLAASILPGAITNEAFHQMRLMGYAVFILVLTIPAVEWLLGVVEPTQIKDRPSESPRDNKPDRSADIAHHVPRAVRVGLLGILLIATVAQAIDFQKVYHQKGPERVNEFDTLYKPVYDRAVAQPQRPIYLENGQWGPAYMNAYWYATVEGRPMSEFVRLPDGKKPPPGAIVLSSNSECQNCETIQKSGCYLLYKQK